MNLITQTELARMSKGELHTLFRTVSDGVAALPPGSKERSIALATLQGIQRELATRAPSP
jgi:hypothetical protein